MEQTQELTKAPNESAFSLQTFDHAQRVAKMLSSSSLIPKEYQGRVDNCLIALEMANRNGSSPLMVMQNLHIIQGKPSWSSPFIIGSINSCGRFSSKLKFKKSGANPTSDDYGYEAYATEKGGDELIGPKVTWKMVKDEGWLSKAGSKWKTMPELMFQYRSAAFFGRLYCPEIMMGMQTVEEIVDVQSVDVTQEEVKKNKEAERIVLMIKNATTIEELNGLSPHVGNDQLDLFTVKMDELKAKK